MRDNDSVENPDLNKKLDDAHQQLLMDEEFQQIRTFVLRSIDKEKLHLLHKNEQKYIQEHQSPPELDQQIGLQYKQFIKKVPQKNKKSVFDSMRDFFSVDNYFGFTFPNMGLVAMGLLVGVLLGPQWESLFFPPKSSISEVNLTNNEISDYSKIEQVSNMHSKHWSEEMDQFFSKVELLENRKQIKSIDNKFSALITSMQNDAALGKSNAQAFLGRIYEEGYQVKQNDKIAIKWYKKAAIQGEAQAQNNLGKMYQNGWGVRNNEKQAMHWFTQAAENGYAEAQYNLALLYLNSLKVQNKDQADKWLKKAVDQGYERARFTLEQLSDSKPSSTEHN